MATFHILIDSAEEARRRSIAVPDNHPLPISGLTSTRTIIAKKIKTDASN
jgi:hypothetical protein